MGNRKAGRSKFTEYMNMGSPAAGHCSFDGKYMGDAGKGTVKGLRHNRQRAQ